MGCQPHPRLSAACGLNCDPCVQHSDVPRCTAPLGRAQGSREGGVRAGGGGVHFHTIKGNRVWGVYRGTLISDGRERFGFLRTLIGGTTKELLVVPPCFNQSEVIAVHSTVKILVYRHYIATPSMFDSVNLHTHITRFNL